MNLAEKRHCFSLIFSKSTFSMYERAFGDAPCREKMISMESALTVKQVEKTRFLFLVWRYRSSITRFSFELLSG